MEYLVAGVMGEDDDGKILEKELTSLRLRLVWSVVRRWWCVVPR